MNKLINKSFYCMDRALREMAGAAAIGDREAMARISRRIAKIGLAIEDRAPGFVFVPTAVPIKKPARRRMKGV